jgi:hypothetical protein
MWTEICGGGGTEAFCIHKIKQKKKILRLAQQQSGADEKIMLV